MMSACDKVLVDLNSEFNRIVGTSFKSIDEFRKLLRDFELQTATSYIVKSCTPLNTWFKESGIRLPERLGYQHVKYGCVHSTRKTRNDRVEPKRPRYVELNCEASVSLVEQDCQLVVKSLKMIHNHNFQNNQPWLYAKNRHLTADQEAVIYDMVRQSSDTQTIRRVVEDNFGIHLTRHDIRHVRDRLLGKTVQGPNLAIVQQLLESKGPYIVSYIEHRQTRVLTFTTESLKKLALAFGDVFLLYCIHPIHKCNYALWCIMIIDRTGIARTVFYAILSHQKQDAFYLALDSFKKIMSLPSDVQALVVSKRPALMYAISHVFPKTPLVMCSFHLLADVREQFTQTVPSLNQLLSALLEANTSAEYDSALKAISDSSSELFQYLSRNWLGSMKHWAKHMLNEVRTLGSNVIDYAEKHSRLVMYLLGRPLELPEMIEHMIDQTEALFRSGEPIGAMLHMSEDEKSKLGPDLLDALNLLTDYAQRILLQHYKCESVDKVVNRRSSCDVYSGEQKYAVSKKHLNKCRCTFHVQWDLPCKHVIETARTIGEPLVNLLAGSRWLHGFSNTEVKISKCSRSARISRIMNRLKSVLTQLDDEDFERNACSVETLIDHISAAPNCHISSRICQPAAVHEIARVSSA
ncbi:unnamed protein product [Calicophoron daubneyi]|uniref:SWIM-type domain-containing protein n=1 Tax=Calicophoron daubneyi TaxID=300641 RepID=A0AAV2TEY0_CALDB